MQKQRGIHRLLAAVFFLFIAVFISQNSYGASTGNEKREKHEAALNALKNELLSYFEPVAADIVSVDKKVVIINKAIKAGTRLNVFKEGISFIHPVTKEPLGKIEAPLGYVEITSSGETTSTGVILEGNAEEFSGAKVKIKGSKVKLLFSQGNVEWFLGDSYYQFLKDSGRFELIDSGIDDGDAQKLAVEVKTKGADIALALKAGESSLPGSINLSQMLLWPADNKFFSEKTTSVDMTYAKELRFKSGFFAASEGEVLLSFKMPIGARKLAAGDFDGNATEELAFAHGDKVSIYSIGVDLKLLWTFTVPHADDILWIEAADVTGNKKDEIIITVMYQNTVNSYVYGLGKAGSFNIIYQAPETFLRTFESGLIGQDYDKSEGYSANVFRLLYSNGGFKKGEALKLPAGVNIYDFQFLYSSEGKKAAMAWDDIGFVNLYNDAGALVWRTSEDFGGFSVGYKKEAPTVMVERGSWFIKDRLIMKNNAVFVPKKKPLLGIAKGLGYSSSEIKSLWWNGFSVEEGKLIEEIGGEILDYSVVGDKIYVLSNPLLGINFKNIMKGENPIGIMLYVFSLKARGF
jgi:hypothetical protein